jgi:diaminopimelate epimerase
MTFTFTKMHGLGNDFVVIDAINQSISLETDQIQFIADRHFGIGCDQLLLVESSDVSEADFRYRIFNSDGGEVAQCGNGARCFAAFVYEQGLTNKTEIPVITQSGLIVLKREPDGQVTVDMGIPSFKPESLPFLPESPGQPYSLDIDGKTIHFSAISVGNPHAVIVVDDIETAPVEELGAKIQAHDAFPESVNVGFMQIIDRSHIRLRVLERGAGETLACGTGACAAVIAGRSQGLLDNTVAVNLSGGNLSIHWEDEQNPVMMTGPTATVFTGTITLPSMLKITGLNK